MKMNGQSRTFVKQVKLDLLALCDSDLSQIIQQWVERSNLTEKSPEIAEETWFALGYTRTLADTETLSQLGFDAPGSESEKPASWNAPDPQHLRTLLTAMDEQQFAQYVITLAFQTLHPIYPEWYDGLTFNAHLANYLRQFNLKRRTMTIKQSIWEVYSETKKAESMKYYVTYCITHPEHTPMTSTGLVEARTRLDLDARLERGVGKWKKRGYAIEIIKVACIEEVQSTVHE